MSAKYQRSTGVVVSRVLQGILSLVAVSLIAFVTSIWTITVAGDTAWIINDPFTSFSFFTFVWTIIYLPFVLFGVHHLAAKRRPLVIVLVFEVLTVINWLITTIFWGISASAAETIEDVWEYYSIEYTYASAPSQATLRAGRIAFYIIPVVAGMVLLLFLNTMRNVATQLHKARKYPQTIPDYPNGTNMVMVQPYMPPNAQSGPALGYYVPVNPQGYTNAPPPIHTNPGQQYGMMYYYPIQQQQQQQQQQQPQEYQSPQYQPYSPVTPQSPPANVISPVSSPPPPPPNFSYTYPNSRPNLEIEQVSVMPKHF